MSASDQIDPERLLASGAVARVEHFESLASTQDRAIELARAGASPLPLLVVAEQQTAGRGRGQNRWWTGRGSLAFSLVFDPADWSLSTDVPPARSLAVGVAITETIRPLLQGIPVGLHWPNDVYAGGRKIAGILVDVLAGGRHVVGIGLNVNNTLADAPEELGNRATSLCDLANKEFERTALLTDLLGNLRHAVRESAASPGDFGLRFNELCLQIGRELTVDVAGRRTTGLCAGIAPDGALVLETPAGRERFFSGVLR
jgi:BirA family biotin operon repressor/biotin-[acetyl-CoA-carboxylase] ligase